MQIRLLSTSSALYEKKVPGFLKTVIESSKPPLSKPELIVKPFGYEKRVDLGEAPTSLLNMFKKQSPEKRQRQLDFDIKHSSFYDYKSFNNTKGKLFKPPKSYFKREVSKFFPNLLATNLSNKQAYLYDIFRDRVTILRVFSTVSGENCVNSYIQDFLDEDGFSTFLSKYPYAQMVDLNIPQNWAKGLFVKLSKKNIANKIPSARIETYFVLPSNIWDVDVKETLKCDNSSGGYTYVVDDEARIRWATSGFCDEIESSLLWKTVEGLGKELSARG